MATTSWTKSYFVFGCIIMHRCMHDKTTRHPIKFYQPPKKLIYRSCNEIFAICDMNHSQFIRWIMMNVGMSVQGNLDNRSGGQVTDCQTKTSRYCLSNAYYRSVLLTITKFLGKRNRPLQNPYEQQMFLAALYLIPVIRHPEHRAT